jgi:galactose mutarotase-like enzyme
MFQIENDRLRVVIDAKGAELKSVYSKTFGIEYMWSADPAYWSKTSPVLFPIVGTLKENTYQYKGQTYHLSRHGFARDKVFQVKEQCNDSITFSLESDQDTLAVYPFQFTFSIIYTLAGDELSVEYHAQNEGKETMFFSVGGHPAFRVPLVEGTLYEDYRLVFEREEKAGRWPISKEGLIEKVPQPLLQQTKVLPLTKELFSKDALVLKHLQSQWVQLASDKTPHGLRFSFPDFPYLGLWAVAGADFICIEPWCGIADSVDSDQQLSNKEGILKLLPEEAFRRQWAVHFY